MSSSESFELWCTTNNSSLLSEWNYIKNGELKPGDISSWSHKKVWWKCKKGHEWEAVLKNRTMSGNGCPYCSGRYAWPGENDLQTHYPDIAKEWHPIKNGKLLPIDVTLKSSKKVWWKCENGHEWYISVSKRVNSKIGCPYCRGKLLKGYNDLLTLYPDIAKEWHPEKNGSLCPRDVRAMDQIKVWWIGPCGHEFYTQIYQRTKHGRNCPYCSGRILPEYNDFATRFPEILSQWHPTKNENINPNTLSPSDTKKYWWICPIGHEYKANISNRTKNNSGCPFCSNKKVLKGFNDLQTTHPELVDQWHPTKNGSLTPFDITYGSNRRVWWICKKGHEWDATVSNRTKNGCPYCSHSRFKSGYNDLLTLYPDIAKEWHPYKNEELPENVPSYSRNDYWWLGSCGHEWLKSPFSRTYNGTGCPICLSESHTSFNEQALYYFIKKMFPDTKSCFRPDVLNGRELDVYVPKLNLAIEYDGDSFHQNIKRDELKAKLCAEQNIRLIRIREPRCPLLSDNVECFYVSTVGENAIIESLIFIEKYISEEYGLFIEFDKNIDDSRPLIYEQMIKSKKERSLAIIKPNLAKMWHPTKNGFLKPDMVGFASSRVFWWLGSCGHEWSGVPDFYEDDATCPYCSGVRILPGFNDLLTLNPELSKEWHPTKNGSLTPANVSPGSNKNVWWKCENGHEWKREICSRHHNKSRCPYCSNQNVWTGYNDLLTLFPSIAKEWHPVLNGELQPFEILAGSKLKIWWMCEKGHEWQVSPSSRTYSGSGCPVCSISNAKNKKSLKIIDTDLMDEWDYEKNVGINPSKLTLCSHTIVWWKCKLGHSWQISPHGRRSGRSCPICAGKIILSGYNDLKTKYPEIAEEWNYEKNNGEHPSNISPGSKRKYWWKCPLSHEWEAIVVSRTKMGTGCPICSKINRNKKYHCNVDDLSN